MMSDGLPRRAMNLMREAKNASVARSDTDSKWTALTVGETTHKRTTSQWLAYKQNQKFDIDGTSKINTDMLKYQPWGNSLDGKLS